ncbi:MAG: DUF1062 domain-containing protein [Lachnospiraceae bacterium]|nr:DUF1062 domain-containing protein [Lachnospiraceae bacterium]MDY5869962.1 DUF1062 domain-containing protein [Lachnospiraceae bacterium]
MDYCKTIEYRITPTKAYTIIRNCSGCGRKEHYVSTGNFRVNANGRQLDVWLVYQCEKCKHTYNLPIYERVSPEKIEDAQYQAFLGNDADTALQFGTDRNLFLKNRAEIDIERLECTIEKLNDDCAKHEGVENSEIQIIIHNPYMLPIRTDRLLPEILQMSRSKIRQLIKDGSIQYFGSNLAERTEIKVYYTDKS